LSTLDLFKQLSSFSIC